MSQGTSGGYAAHGKPLASGSHLGQSHHSLNTESNDKGMQMNFSSQHRHSVQQQQQDDHSYQEASVKNGMPSGKYKEQAVQLRSNHSLQLSFTNASQGTAPKQTR